MKDTLALLRKYSILLFMTLLLISIILTSHSLYVNKPSEFATPEELISSVLQNKNIRVADMAIQDSTIRNRTFEGCQLYGPVVFMSDRVTFYDCHMEGGRAALIRTPNTRLWGVVKLQDCVFRKCNFFKIGFIGPPEAMDHLESELKFVHEPMP